MVWDKIKEEWVMEENDNAAVEWDENGDMIITCVGLDGKLSSVKIDSGHHVHKLVEENAKLKERVVDLYMGDEPNYKSKVFMNKMDYLIEHVHDLEEKLEAERKEKEYYKDRYDKIYDKIYDALYEEEEGDE